MAARAKPPWLGILLLLFIALAWGSNWTAMKIVFSEFAPLTFRAATSLISGACVIAYAKAVGHDLRVPPAERAKVAIAAVLNITCWQVLVAYGTMRMVSGHIAMLSFTTPLWTALLGAAVLRQALRPRLALALALSAAGILVLLSRGFAEIGDSPAGVALSLGAGFGAAVALLYQKHQAWTVPLVPLLGWQLVLGAAPMAVVAVLVEGVHLPAASGRAWAAAAYLTLVALLGGYLAWFRVISLFPANVAALGTLMTPIVGMASGAVWLGEPFGWREVAAIALILPALALVMFAPAPTSQAK
ncbi:MAG: DMT family transporter [Pseudomonadota bacterium]